MGLSAKESRIFYIPHNCPIRLDGSPPQGTARQLSEQVVRIEITPSVYQRKYGHDKSYGANDVCSGTKSWDGNLTTKIADRNVANGTWPFSFSAGNTVWLRIYPIGQDCGHPIRGYASIDSDPIVCNIENGEPVEHNYRFSSRGLWKGLPAGAWGGYECACGGSEAGGGSGTASSGGSESGSFPAGSVSALALPADVPAVAEAPQTPMTVYQWNGTSWDVVLDECRRGFTPGLSPTTPGRFAGQLTFVECQIAS